MHNHSLKYLLIILLIAIAVVFLVVFARQDTSDFDPVVEQTNEASTQQVRNAWVSFVAPKDLLTADFELEMTITGRLEQIDVNWTHPATGQTDEHTLNQFVAGNSKATYKAHPNFGNLLAGVNKYEVLAWVVDDEAEMLEATEGEEIDPQANWKSMSAEFEVSFDLAALGEMNPGMINTDTWPDLTESGELELSGSLKEGVDDVFIYSFNDKSKRASFAKLKKYQSGDMEFKYNVSEAYDNLQAGDNLYAIELISGKDVVVARKQAKIISNKLTYADELTSLFGKFSKLDRGWYVSEKLDWFSFRPVYESVEYRVGEPNVILPRPTLLYTAKSAKNKSLCDYLGEIDYEEDNVSYRAFSYETCQQFSRGISIYDRYVSALRHEPFKEVHRTEYKFVEGKASSSFTMIETGGMPESMEESMFDDSAGSFEGMKVDEPKYFVYQMMISEGVDYTEEKIGDIEIELSGERKNMIEKIRVLINSHSGEEFYTEIMR